MSAAASAVRVLPRESRRILGVRVDATSYRQATSQVMEWARGRQSRYVCLATVNNVMEAKDSGAYAEVMESADLVTSDGMPLVWMLRALGVRDASRVYGPDLMLEILAAAEAGRVEVGFYGGSDAVLARLTNTLIARFPRLRIAFAEAPPIREATAEEDRRTVETIRSSGARIVFVGLGSTKQDAWMHAHRGRIDCAMLGVGAAFDFLSGEKAQAPKWMQRAGLEWAFRLATEPRRLGRRYLRHNPRFAVLAVGQWIRSRV